MIYLKEQNITIITPPHTASGNMHKTLCSELYGGEWINGECPFHHEKYNANHHYAVPVEGSKVYYVVRNPYTRLVGLFLHYEWAQENIKTHLDYLCWEEFVINQKELANWMYRASLTEFITKANLNDYSILRYENIEADVSEAIGKKVELLPAYHDPIEISEWYYDADILALAREWGREDCVRYDYPILRLPSMV